MFPEEAVTENEGKNSGGCKIATKNGDQNVERGKTCFLNFPVFLLIHNFLGLKNIKEKDQIFIKD
jgi:hypothetical protein